ncbi:MAG: ATP-binding protein, partial [Anaerolineae bacterium]
MDDLTVPGTLKSVRTIGQYVLTAAEEAGLEERAAYRLRQAVDEIATNAVIHGYQLCGREGCLTVSARLNKGKLTITLHGDYNNTGDAILRIDVIEVTGG